MTKYRMGVSGILGLNLLKLGFELKEEEDFVYLEHRGHVVAVFASCAGTVKEIKRAARAWLREHEKGGEN